MDGKKVGVVGIGYVGLTLSIALAERGFNVECYEKNEPLQETLRRGKPHFFERGLERHLKNALENHSLNIPQMIDACDAYIVCVASPIDQNKKPSTECVESATRSLVPYLGNNPLVVMRSTVPVGVTRNKVLPILEEAGKKAGRDFSLVFAPERTLEGNALNEIYRNPQIIGGYDERSVQRASALFRELTPVIINVSSLEAAEAAKLLDNTYRDFSFGFANIFAQFCEDKNLDAREVTNAANDFYPRNRVPLPSPGVGGVCLTKDPRLLASSSPETPGLGIILSVRDLNEQYPARILARINQRLYSHGKKPGECGFFLTGLSYKGEPETDDIRDSTALLLLKELKLQTQRIKSCDPLVKPEVIRSLGMQPVEDYMQGFHDSDCAIFFNNHHSFQELDIVSLANSMKKPAVIFDSWRMLDSRVRKSPGIDYMSVGL